MGVADNPWWWMRYPYQRTDMEKNALRCATATRQPQDIYVPASDMEEFGMDPGGTYTFVTDDDGKLWALWKTINPDPNGTAAGLPGRRFPWES